MKKKFRVRYYVKLIDEGGKRVMVMECDFSEAWLLLEFWETVSQWFIERGVRFLIRNDHGDWITTTLDKINTINHETKKS